MAGLRPLLPYLWARKKTLLLAYLCMAVLALSGATLAFLSGPALRAVFLAKAAAGAVQTEPARREAVATGGHSLPEKVQAWSTALEQAIARRVPGPWTVPLLLVLTQAIKGLAQAGQFYAMGTTSLAVQRALRRDVFAALLAQPPAFFQRHRQGDLLSRLLSDTALVEQGIFYGLGSLVRDSLTLAALLIFCIRSDAKLAAYTLVAVPAVVLPLVCFSRWLKGAVQRGQSAQGEVASRCLEALQGMATVQACQREDYEAHRLAQAEQRLRTQTERSYAVRAVRTPTMELVGAVGLAALLGGLGQRVAQGGPDAAHYISFFAALLLMYDPVKKLGNVADYLAQTEAALERLRALLLPPGAGQPKDTRATQHLSRARVETRGVQFCNVQFAYGTRTVLQDVSLTLPYGSRVAVVGESGAGKSTLAGLLPRWWDVTGGQICIDGTDLRDYRLPSLRAQMALVAQEPFLMAASVHDNIAYGRQGADPAQVVAAAKAAQAHAFIAALPQGYDTQLGERGGRLSGGQRQRLALARALLRDAPILVLDEATSHLDLDSEASVLAALEPLLRHRATLIIAHRLETIYDADEILVMARGHVVERGSHRALLRRDGAYARLLRLAEREARRRAASPGAPASAPRPNAEAPNLPAEPPPRPSCWAQPPGAMPAPPTPAVSG